MARRSGGMSLLEEYVTFHNFGVRTGDFRPLLVLVADDAEMRFEGIASACWFGKPAIERFFRDEPPTDEIEIVDRPGSPDPGSATFEWKTQPSRPGGTLHIEGRGKRIHRIVVTIPPPAGE